MSNKKIYDNIFAFHPGYYISEIIEDMVISQTEFATRMGTTPKTLSKLINGQCDLSNDLALKIATMLGTSVDVWLNLQKEYDKNLLEIETKKSINEQEEIMKMIDYSFFEQVVGLPKTRILSEKISNLCKCLMISDLRILTQPDFLVNYRTGIKDVQKKNIVNSKAWIQISMNLAKEIEVSPFDAKKLKEHLSEIREMTLQSPEIFLPRLKSIFSDCGVAFVLLPHLKNSGVNGAVKWYGNNQVVLAINNRRCYADTFWFSLFHEIGHILQQKVKTLFVSGADSFTAIDKKLEEEADLFAQNILIPKKEYEQLKPTKYIKDSEIVAFADKIGIHSGIVAGRLQYDKIISNSRCSSLKERYNIVIKY